MTRGIHLKQLKTTDLEAIGVPEENLAEVPEDKVARPASLLAEADPVLSRTIGEVREGLEGTLLLLEAALSAHEATRPSAEAAPETA
jgi:hypothetical protein